MGRRGKYSEEQKHHLSVQIYFDSESPPQSHRPGEEFRLSELGACPYPASGKGSGVLQEKGHLGEPRVCPRISIHSQPQPARLLRYRDSAVFLLLLYPSILVKVGAPRDGCGSPSFLGRPHGQTYALSQISREALVPPPQTITTLCPLGVFCEHGSVYVWGTDVSSMPKPELDTQTCAPSAPPTRNALCAPCTFGTPTAVPRVISGHQEEVLGACGRDTQRTGQQRLSFFLILHQQQRQNPN